MTRRFASSAGLPKVKGSRSSTSSLETAQRYVAWPILCFKASPEKAHVTLRGRVSGRLGAFPRDIGSLYSWSILIFPNIEPLCILVPCHHVCCFDIPLHAIPRHSFKDFASPLAAIAMAITLPPSLPRRTPLGGHSGHVHDYINWPLSVEVCDVGLWIDGV